MDVTRLTSSFGSSLNGRIDSYQRANTQGLRSNKENLQQVANLIRKLEKLNAHVETILEQNE
jgi:ribosomal protein S15P/S13E